MNPMVSVIVPVFNCERFLGQALRSVLAQDYRPLEIIVIDDGSTDGSAAAARSFPEVILLSQANLGVATARNAGLAAARGEVIAFIDADDIWLPEKVSTEMRHLAEHPETGYTVCHLTMFVTPGESVASWFTAQHQEKSAPFCTGLLAARRTVFESVGGFNVCCRRGEDLDWFLRANEAGVRMDLLDAVLVQHREHSSSLTADVARTRRSLLEVAKLSIERRRARSGHESQ
jgi:glycosyltransferase involved in cell wall biosynthesis